VALFDELGHDLEVGIAQRFEAEERLLTDGLRELDRQGAFRSS
jgi:hypothetical protein